SAFATREYVPSPVATGDPARPDDPWSLPQRPACAPPDPETSRCRRWRRPARPARCRPRPLASRRLYRGPDPRTWRLPRLRPPAPVRPPAAAAGRPHGPRRPARLRRWPAAGPPRLPRRLLRRPPHPSRRRPFLEPDFSDPTGRYL